jgi:hypothetical protein
MRPLTEILDDAGPKKWLSGQDAFSWFMERVRKKNRSFASEGTVKQGKGVRASSFLASALPASSCRGMISAS